MTEKKTRVLLVEDNPGDVRLIEEMIKTAGANLYELAVVGTLDSALGRLREEVFDAVLLDLSLPDSSGLATMKSIQGNAPHIALVVITGLNDDAVALEALKIGAEDFFVKGKFDGSNLIRSLKYAIERKKAEHKLREAEERLNLALETNNTGVWELNLLDHTAFRTIIHDNIFGYETLLPSWTYEMFLEHVLPEDRPEVDRRFSEAVAARSDWNFECLIRRTDGEVRWIMAKGCHIQTSKGEAEHMLGIVQDITERKRAQESLRASEKQYRLLADHVHDVIFVLDMNLNYIYVSPSIKALRGYEPEEVMKQPSSKTLTPSSWDLATKTMTEALELEKTEHREINNPPTLQLEMIRKDGTTVWTEVKFSFIKDENQRLVGIMGVTRDITERKLSEERLKQSEEKYRSIFENTQEGIFRTTPDGKIIMANQALSKMFGYESPEEFMADITDVGRQLYVNPEDRRKLKETIEKYGFIKGYEVQNHRKDGSIIWISLTMNAISDSKGQILYYDGLNEDITNRKESAERIRKALEATAQAIAVTIEMRDPYTAGHQRRVADLASSIAKEMNLPDDQIFGIHMAATIHDLGKISVPSEILSKPTKLKKMEFDLIKEHSQSGYDILKDIDFPWPIARMVLEHHERMDGSSYPSNLKGDEILIEARIMAVADVVEAMASHRPYRASLGIEAALEEIEKRKGIIYDDTAADACLTLFREKGYQLA
jgi:PAS domain S-box-containing protein